MAKRHAEIAGAGIAGLTVASALAQRGWSVRVHERGSELREIGAGIFIWENGIKVLENIGVMEELEGIGEWKKTFKMIDERSEDLMTMNFTPEDRLYMVVRTDLHRALVDVARNSGVDILTDSHVVGADPSGELLLGDGTKLKADLVIGADGLNSKVRESLGLKRNAMMLEEGCARFLIKRTEDDPLHTATEYWNGTRRVGYVPVNKDYVYVYTTCLEEDTLGKQIPIHRETWIEAFPHLDYVFNRVGSDGRRDKIPYVTCDKWSIGYAAILGDSTHAMPPNLGQGAGISLTNALSLAVELESHSDILAGLEEWEKKTKEVVEVTQRWSAIYGHVSSRWPKELMDVRSDFLWAALRSPWIEEQMSMAARYVVGNSNQVSKAQNHK